MALDGAFVVRNISGAWTIPAGAAAWIPAGARHSVEPMPRARVRTVYLRRDLVRPAHLRCMVVALTPLVGALSAHVSAAGALMAGDAVATRLCRVLIDQLRPLAELPLFVPELRTPLAVSVAAALAADPSDTPRIRDLAAAMCVNARTIERTFAADAAMTIGEWRQRARICRAIGLLAAGISVKQVALESGYSTPTAFITAFKRYTGTTPGRISPG